MRHLYLTPLVAIVLALNVSAQSFENVKASASGNKVSITYDLLASRSEDTYAVEIFGSHDNFTNPIRLVSGDVGTNVKPGTNKSVEWRVEDELKSYKGIVTFELRGKQNILKLNFKNPVAGKSVRRGKRMNIAWGGGLTSEDVRINLYQGDIMIAPVTEVRNMGEYTWVLPKSTKKGGGYYLKMTSAKTNESVISGQFKVKSKTPMLVKILPFIAIGAAVPFVLGGSGGGDSGGGGTPGGGGESLPTAPGPPGG
jgi:hypothetical protein